MSQNLDLFGCDHYPPWERIWEDGKLICHKCGEILKPKKEEVK
ncbi:hypothetical protein [Geoanaerobacter pelophilus]|nr:hypothetical protein [Geoanaerobacter pelophilus]